jgi:hypothetical protein
MTLKALLAVLILSSPISAFASTCGPKPFEVDVRLAAPRETLDMSLDSAALAKMGNMSMIGVTQGLTQVEYEISLSTEYEATSTPDSRWCSRARKVTATFGFKSPPKIFLANGLARGSCLYNAVLRHEYQHLAIAKETLTEGKAWIGKAVNDILALGGATGPTAQLASDTLERSLMNHVEMVTKRLYHRAEVRNLSLDTPENYRRLGASCP